MARPAKKRAAASSKSSRRQGVEKRRAASFVYVLGSGRHTYVGWTTDPERRLGQHNDGTGAKSTRGRQWILLYVERYDASEDAMSREWHLKRDRKFRRLLSRG